MVTVRTNYFDVKKHQIKPEPFCLLTLCPAGTLLVKGQLYENQKTGSVILSLGFRECACLAIPLDKWSLGGEAGPGQANLFFQEKKQRTR